MRDVPKTKQCSYRLVWKTCDEKGHDSRKEDGKTTPRGAILVHFMKVVPRQKKHICTQMLPTTESEELSPGRQ